MTNQQNDENVAVKEPRKRIKWLKIGLIVLGSIVGLILLLLIIFAVLWFVGKAGMTQKSVQLTPTDNIQVEIDSDDIVNYNGKKYKYNSNMSTILCMGIDDEKEMQGNAYVTGNAGQADAIYLVAVDTSNGKTTVVGIPRDSMTDVDIYSKAGNFVGVENTQLCLAYAYGDGKIKSAENTAKSVSRLLYGIPVNMYFAFDKTSMATLHNAVGPITVVPNESLNDRNITLRKGEALKLTGSNAFYYLKARNQETEDASYLRMERQLDYLKKYAAAAIEKTKGNILFPVDLYKGVVNKAVTNLDVSRVTYLTTTVLGNKDSVVLDFKQITGKQIKGENNFAEFYPDETALFELILEIFYEEI